MLSCFSYDKHDNNCGFICRGFRVALKYKKENHCYLNNTFRSDAEYR